MLLTEFLKPFNYFFKREFGFVLYFQEFVWQVIELKSSATYSVDASSGEQKVPEIGCQERAARWAMLEPWQRDGHCAAGKPPLGRYGRCQAVLSVLDVRFTHLLFEHRREGQSREALLGASSKSLPAKVGPVAAYLLCKSLEHGTLSRSICTHKQR